MTKLSPAAQAVLDAAINVAESPDAEAIAAAVLRALAFNVYSDEIVTCGGSSYALVIEQDDILAIADELEGVKYGTYRSDLEDKPQ
jgi:hypothetical protein